MYYLSKIVWFFLEPSNALVLGASLGLVILPWRPRLGQGLVAGSVVALLIGGLSPAGTILLRVLEQRFPAYVEDERPVAGAIILGGALSSDVAASRGQIALNEAAERVVAILELARRFPGGRLVFTGGAGDLAGDVSEADALRPLLEKLAPGVQVTFERQSRNTRENAVLTRALVAPAPDERWLLVTSAWHMPRAIGIFRKQGFVVTAFPVDYRTTGTGADWHPFGTISNGLRRLDLAAKEWVGLLFAYGTGQSSSLFPGP